MKSPVRLTRIVFLLTFFAMSFSLALGACEPTVKIIIRNDTDQTLEIFTGNTFINSASPGKEVNWEIGIIYPDYDIRASDAEGNLVYAKTITKEEMIKNKWRVVITPDK